MYDGDPKRALGLPFVSPSLHLAAEVIADCVIRVKVQLSGAFENYSHMLLNNWEYVLRTLLGDFILVLTQTFMV